MKKLLLAAVVAAISAGGVFAAESVEKAGSDPFRGVKAAIREAQVPALEDYGWTFAYGAYPKETGLSAILAKVTGNDESDIDLSSFDISTGVKAVRAFLSVLREEEKLQNEDGESENARLMGAVAEETEKAFSGPENFVRVRFAEHSIQEDGDLQSATLVGERPDGSFFAVYFTHFPF